MATDWERVRILRDEIRGHMKYLKEEATKDREEDVFRLELIMCILEEIEMEIKNK